MRTIYLATANRHKFEEFEILLGGRLSLEKMPTHFNLPEEGLQSYEDNARDKAETLGKALGVNALGDDSGLEVDALPHVLGVASARFGGLKNIADQQKLLLDRLKTSQNRRARFVCCLAYYCASQSATHIFWGRVEGVIVTEMRGKGGFGYDPLFLPEGHSETFSEMPVDLKNKISHRAIASNALLRYLESARVDDKL